MPFRQSFTAALNAANRRRIRRRARARYEQRRGPGLSPRTTALIVASALFMEQLDGTVLATALPEMARSFGTEAVRLNVALTSYLLALAVFIPASGKVADRFGVAHGVLRRHRAVHAGVHPVRPGHEPGGMLVAARVLQGIGGAMMVPVGRLVLLRSVTKAEMVTAMTWLMIPAQLGPLVGPPVGGFLVTYLSWRWIFYINVPIGLLGIALALRYIADVREPGRVNFDLPGLVLSGLSLACLVFGLEAVEPRRLLPGRGSRHPGSGRGRGRLLCPPRPAAPGAGAGPAPDARADLRAVRRRRRAEPGGRRRRPVPAADDAATGVRHVRARRAALITFAGSAGSMLMRFVATPGAAPLGVPDGDGLERADRLGASWAASPSSARPGRWRPSMLLLIVGGFFQSLQFTAYNTIAYADIPRDRR